MRQFFSLIGLIFWLLTTIILVITFIGIIVIIDDDGSWMYIGRKLCNKIIT